MKTKQSDAKIVESLENLQAEIEKHGDTRSREIWFKINSFTKSQIQLETVIRCIRDNDTK